ncbi:hypothetical protein M378DRAFT_168986 [Amanita muscaria Koide BX008]|uniref:Uncharacterized protein n=1 Tax=Amanita muscaria (strain Koide BX008) TaxID=946122 RepID=A0A0C2SA72_AMAMK|nr:hypothetical protein M378DRAFT_168986 [Amanita muscaria Koide BX008]
MDPLVPVVVLLVYVTFVTFKQLVYKPCERRAKALSATLPKYSNSVTMTDLNKIKIGKGLDAEGVQAIVVGAAVTGAEAVTTRKSSEPSQWGHWGDVDDKFKDGIPIGHASTARNKDSE